MRIALGVHVSTYEVTASLVDTSLPELGPVASRIVPVATAPGGIGGAVSAALGFMRVQAMQNDLHVDGAAVVCENALQREIIADALAESESTPPLVVDIFHESLSDAFTPDVSAALLVGEVQSLAAPAPARVEPRSTWPVAAVGACVLAMLGGVTAWAMTSQPASESTPTNEMVYPSGAAGATADPARVVAPEPAPAPIDPAEPEGLGADIVPGYPSGGGAVLVPPVVEPTVGPPFSTTPGSTVKPPTATSDPTTPGGGSDPVDPKPDPTPDPTLDPTTDPTTDPTESPTEEPEPSDEVPAEPTVEAPESTTEDE